NGNIYARCLAADNGLAGEQRPENTMEASKMKNESRDLAKYFQAHRDDEGEWQDSAEPAVIGRSPSVVYSLRLAAPELAELRRAANARGLSLSELIRNAALQHVRESNVS